MIAVEEGTIPAPPPLPPGEIGTAHEDTTFKPGQFWMVVTFFDPQILQGHPGGGKYNPWNREQYLWYEKNVLGGVWIRWDSEEDYFMEEKPGTVEFLAAGAGYGPDVIEAAARVAEVPLVLDRQSTWEAKELFKHYGGSVSPSAARFAFRKVPLTKPLIDTKGVVKRVAAAAYNRLGSPHLPRYQEDSDSFRQDLKKVEADTRAAVNPRRPRASRRKKRARPARKKRTVILRIPALPAEDELATKEALYGWQRIADDYEEDELAEKEALYGWPERDYYEEDEYPTQHGFRDDVGPAGIGVDEWRELGGWSADENERDWQVYLAQLRAEVAGVR